MRRPLSRTFRAFTLIEILVASTVLVIILGLMLSVINHVSAVWRDGNAKIEAFQGARIAFERLTTNLEQATLNTYYDYDNNVNPTRYLRRSELHFLVTQAGFNNIGTLNTGQAVFFCAPANKTVNHDGMMGLVNAGGFFIQFGSDEDWMPKHVASDSAKSRFRLMQWMQDTEDLSVYAYGNVGVGPNDWIEPTAQDVFPIADNVIALVIWPREGGSVSDHLNSYGYDSRSDGRAVAINQLPPILQVAMVAIDEPSALRFGDSLEETIADCLNGLFQTAPYGDGAPTDVELDLQKLEDRLTAQSIKYRVFTSSVVMREAKWSPQ